MSVHNPSSPCACTVDFARRIPGSPTNEFAIRYCAAHAAAPQLLAAAQGAESTLREISRGIDAWFDNHPTGGSEASAQYLRSVNVLLERTRAALAAARGEG